MKSSKALLISLVILAVLLAAAYTVYSFIKEIERPRLPVIGKVNHFELTDSTGQPFGSDQLRGKVWIADFFFTTCGDICPVMSKNMASLHRTFEHVPDVSVVSITVNPEFDSPQVLSRYAEKFDADTGKWKFLTGDREAVGKLMLESFKIGHIKEPIFHSAKFALVDRLGNIRRYYEGTDTQEINQLFKDASALVKEKRIR
jgi:protein SCO1/2